MNRTVLGVEGEGGLVELLKVKRILVQKGRNFLNHRTKAGGRRL